MSIEQAEKLIPATVRMISGCRDEQTSADVSNVANFQLPDPAGRSVSDRKFRVEICLNGFIVSQLLSSFTVYRAALVHQPC